MNCDKSGSYKKFISQSNLVSNDTNKIQQPISQNEVQPLVKSKTNPDKIDQPKKKQKKSLEENKSSNLMPEEQKTISEYEKKISELNKEIKNYEKKLEKHKKEKRQLRKEKTQLSNELEACQQKLIQIPNGVGLKGDSLSKIEMKMGENDNNGDFPKSGNKERMAYIENKKIEERKSNVSENSKKNTFLSEYALPNPKEKTTIRLSELIKEKKIEDVQGAFGTLYLFVDKISKSKKYAIKTIPIEKKNEAQIKNEIKIWEKLQKCEKKPKSIPNFHGSECEEYLTQTGKEIKYHLIFDYFSYSLKNRIDNLSKKKGNFPLKKLLIFSKSLIDTLAYLQTLKVCHRDLKPANLLVDDNEENIFVIDFGESKEIENYAESTITSFAGTRKYLSPELHKISQSISEERMKKKLGKLDFYKSDVFSLGLVLLEMAVLSVPNRIDNDEEAYLEEININIYKVHENYKETAKKEGLEEELDGFETILRQCLRIIPKERPDFISLFLHWMENFEKEKDEKIQKMILLSENN